MLPIQGLLLLFGPTTSACRHLSAIHVSAGRTSSRGSTEEQQSTKLHERKEACSSAVLHFHGEQIVLFYWEWDGVDPADEPEFGFHGRDGQLDATQFQVCTHPPPHLTFQNSNPRQSVRSLTVEAGANLLFTAKARMNLSACTLYTRSPSPSPPIHTHSLTHTNTSARAGGNAAADQALCAATPRRRARARGRVDSAGEPSDGKET